MSNIYFRYPEFCKAHNIYYIRDYVEFFIEWYAKRTKHYISDQWLIDINCRLRKKYGRDAARIGPKKHPYLNERFGLEADGPFCRVSYYELVPMNGELCSVCGKPTASIESEACNRLSEYNSRFINYEREETLDISTYTLCIETLNHMHPRREPINGIGKACCKSQECNRIAEWLFSRKRYSVRLNTPSTQMLAKQNIKFRKSFLAARFLDFEARLINSKIKQNDQGVINE